ncbi:MAG: hypothetical protein Q7W16_09325 [Coriobacteriia bacterium]|nr:hypothetical protein [Coriobacteriia bacterium]
MTKRHRKAASKGAPTKSGRQTVGADKGGATASRFVPARYEGDAARYRWIGAFVLGILFGGSLVLAVPGGAYVAWPITGLFIGLFEERRAWSVGVAIAVGLVVAALQQWSPGGIPVDAAIMWIVGPLLAAGGAFVGRWVGRVAGAKAGSWLIVATLALLFLIQAGAVAGPVVQRVGSEPRDEGYAFDPVFFVKVFYMTDRGTDYYQAYGDAFRLDARFDAPPADVAGWRAPTVTAIWSALFDSGTGMLNGFIILCAASMVGAYFIGSRSSDPVSALVIPALMYPYYLYAVAELWFPEYEFWAGFVAIGAAALYVAGRERQALGAGFLAGAMREWLIASTLAGFADQLRRKEWKRLVPWGLAVVAVVAVYIVNMLLVRQYLVGVGLVPGLGAAGRAGAGGPGFVLYTLQFCSGLYAHPYAIPYTVFALALVGAVRRVMEGDWYLPVCFLAPVAAFLVFGSTMGRPGALQGWNDYYNAAFMPFAFILVASSWRMLGGWKRRL